MRQTEIFWVFKTTCRFVSPNCAELGFVVAIGSKSRFGEFGFFFYLLFLFFIWSSLFGYWENFAAISWNPNFAAIFRTGGCYFSFVWIWLWFWLEPLLCLGKIWMNFYTVLILISNFFFFIKFFVWLLRKFCGDFLKPKKVSFFVVVDVNFSFVWIWLWFWLELLLCLSDIWMNFCTVLILISRFSNYLTDLLNLISFFWSIGLFRMKYF